ncbi:aspartate aminotransferase family protein [Agrobacterium vitis]|uniref:Aspartate aminotransferase family protein n=1 Tax=Agrobacterium vitis TaxID=373 RepID=A0AAE2RKB0_AGRVI|nr:aspartate aminotransferase family protein [Agrobacterium vitis]MBF2718256.1 aspartate aminotransferase family protein [Agrobacterium vitis]MVA19398.1 aminotransferase class III-fold pyridoxal phosphate-dependent enzyme [Agrobacterium vitis]
MLNVLLENNVGAYQEALSISVSRHQGGAPAMVGALDCHLYDDRGRSFLDMTGGSGAVNLGHQHPEIVSALTLQAGKLIHTGWNIDNPFRHEMIDRLEHFLPFPEASVMGAVTGAEAVEVAVKIARKKTGREPILYFANSFHGKTQGALSVTSNGKFRDLLAMGLKDNPWFSLAGPGGTPVLDSKEWGLAFRQFLQDTKDRHQLPAAAIIEPIQAAEGIFVIAPSLLAEMISACAEFGVLSIFDEIYTGLGRTGTPFVASRQVCPDMIVLGKSLGNGVPVSAVAGPPSIIDVLGFSQHSSTFTFMPLACAVANAVLEVQRRDNIADRAAQSGGRFTERLHELANRDDRISGIRGTGLMLAFDVAISGSGARVPLAAEVGAELLKNGVIVRTGGLDGATVKLTPPLTFSEAHMDEFFAALDKTLESCRCQ